MKKFLIAHPDHFTQRAIEVTLRDLHHITIHARDGLDVIDRALDDLPDAIVLGTELPGLGGLDVARTCRALAPTQRIPILFITSDSAETRTVHEADIAGVQCAQLPLDLARVREQLVEMTKTKMPTDANDPIEPELSAITDPVTGLYGRAYMLHRLAYEAARSNRYDNMLAVILIAIENPAAHSSLKNSPGTDRTLAALGNLLKRSLRVVDLAGRIAADQFLVLAPQTGALGAQTLAVRLRSEIARLTAQAADGEGLLVRMGIAVSGNSTLSDNLALLARAQAALDKARQEPATPVVVG